MNYVLLVADDNFYVYNTENKETKYKRSEIEKSKDIQSISIDDFYISLQNYANERPIEEEGCLSYNVVRNGNEFHFYEVYANAKALKEHSDKKNIEQFRNLKAAAGFARGPVGTKINNKYFIGPVLTDEVVKVLVESK